MKEIAADSSDWARHADCRVSDSRMHMRKSRAGRYIQEVSAKHIHKKDVHV